MSREIRQIAFVAIAIVSFALLGTSTASAQEYDTERYSFREHSGYSEYSGYRGYGSSRPLVTTEWGIGISGVHTGIFDISTSDVKLKPRIGFSGHVDMAVCIGRNFAIEAEVGYEGGSLSVATERLQRRVRTRTVNIPLLFSVRMLGSRLRLDFGPMFTVMSRAEYSVDGETMFFGPVYPTWNIAAGIGVGLSRHFIIEARYIHALKDNINQFDGIEFTTRSRRITVGVSLHF